MGPYFFGEVMTMADVVIAPVFDMWCVLEHYRKFFIPTNEPEYDNWWTWKKNVLKHPAVKPTRVPKEKLIEYYKKYVGPNPTARDKFYEKYYKNYDLEEYTI
jgi:glutathione S-transferase